MVLQSHLLGQHFNRVSSKESYNMAALETQMPNIIRAISTTRGALRTLGNCQPFARIIDE
jgi:hypothetical protein